MLVYALQLSNRLQYILDFIGKEIFTADIQLTTDREDFGSYNGPKINYSSSKVSDKEFWIYNAELLFEADIKSQDFSCFTFNGNKAFFQTSAGDYLFDIFAASFYLMSRYEEYLPHEKDSFGRYAHINSLAYRESFLHLPIINFWLDDFKKALLRKYADLEIVAQSFAYLPTYDIDIAWSYRNKGWWRGIGGLLRSALQRDWFAFKERLAVVFKGKQDPFDSYAWLHHLHKHHQLQAIYFFLMAFKQTGVDKNVSPFNKDLRRLIKQHASLYTVGIHPSWQSGDNSLLLQNEINELANVIAHSIVHSRQHYLRFSLPATYRELINAGILKDYSMGYGTINGFRASVASSFNWYDLEKESTSDLRIYPFCFMDANAYYVQKLSPTQALEQLRSFHKTIKEINGLMITIWHNNFLGTDPAFAGWRDVYEIFLKEIRDN